MAGSGKWSDQSDGGNGIIKLTTYSKRRKRKDFYSCSGDAAIEIIF